MFFVYEKDHSNTKYTFFSSCKVENFEDHHKITPYFETAIYRMKVISRQSNNFETFLDKNHSFRRPFGMRITLLSH